MEIIKYKDYLGSCQWSLDDGCYYGKILEIEDNITYQSTSYLGLIKAFKEAVEEYTLD